MRKHKRIIVLFFVVEMLVIAFYFYNQPMCEPCIPGEPCPPCVSESQIAAKWIASLIAILMLCYLIIYPLRRKKEFIYSKKKIE